MPAKWIKCPDGEVVKIEKCLSVGGCRMEERCATLPYLREICYDREWKGVSASSAGSGAWYLYLKATHDYTISANDRAFAALGTGVHGKLSLHHYTENVLAEQFLRDDEMGSTPDCLEEDEHPPIPFEDAYILSDYKTWGSYKVAKAKGIYVDKEPVKDKDGNPVRYKSGKKKDQIKTKNVIKQDDSKIDMRETELQLNRYRILFEMYGFPISKMRVQAIIRDGGTYIAKNRGIESNIEIIPVKRLSDGHVLHFYKDLQIAVNMAFEGKKIPICNAWESWDGRRCNGYCEVSDVCKKLRGERTF